MPPFWVIQGERHEFETCTTTPQTRACADLYAFDNNGPCHVVVLRSSLRSRRFIMDHPQPSPPIVPAVKRPVEMSNQRNDEAGSFAHTSALQERSSVLSKSAVTTPARLRSTKIAIVRSTINMCSASSSCGCHRLSLHSRRPSQPRALHVQHCIHARSTLYICNR